MQLDQPLGAGQNPRKQEAEEEEEVPMRPNGNACILPVLISAVSGRCLPVMETAGQHKMLPQASQAPSTTTLNAGTATQRSVVLFQTPAAIQTVSCKTLGATATIKARVPCLASLCDACADT